MLGSWPKVPGLGSSLQGGAVRGPTQPLSEERQCFIVSNLQLSASTLLLEGTELGVGRLMKAG